MSGLLYWDGYGHDPRVQFGQREAPVRLGRQSTYLRFAMFTELRRHDQTFPPKMESIVEWMACRLHYATGANMDEARWAVLFYVLIYVDDVAGGSINDKLYDLGGQPVMREVDGVLTHVARARAHYDICVSVLLRFGHGESAQAKASLQRCGVTSSELPSA